MNHDCYKLQAAPATSRVKKKSSNAKRQILIPPELTALHVWRHGYEDGTANAVGNGG